VTILLFILQHTLLVSSTITFTQPNASTIWVPGESYDILIASDSKDAIQSWNVDLIVLGAKCDGICLHDGVVKEISQGYSLQCTLRFKVPTDLVQYGKVRERKRYLPLETALLHQTTVSNYAVT
jgi:hypothetical protein